ncbi:hypothetical protein LAWI1_G008486 [Lachnellula willkommii]|uniref:Mid2 domain-containing protein n=1 Tax=Lachnellula willkommii TaxID=215461 RepID=A0A559M059_9HELO|nr:hypothetical protein LAWI1_G008486 [Lachnellula willkommii]
MGRLLLLAPLLIASVNATATCWYPDNKTSEPTHVPCNQTTSTASACCDPNDSCSVSGFCLGQSGWIYRGSCTDQSWDSANCPNKFEQCLTNPDTQKPESYWAAVWSCADRGAAPTKFCCGFGTESCCNSSFTLGTTGVAFKPGLDAFVQSVSAAAVSSAMASAIASTSASATTGTTASPAAQATTSESVEANCTSAGDALGTKIGVGVGVPLGVLAVGVLSFLFWRESRRRNIGAGISLVDLKGAGEAYHPPQPWKGPISPIPIQRYSPDQQKVNPWSPVARERAHEIDTSPRVQELPNPGLGKI